MHLNVLRRRPLLSRAPRAHAAPLRVRATGQTRAEPVENVMCYANHTCYGDGAVRNDWGDGGDKNRFGVGASYNRFQYWKAADLGANPAGANSASQLSYRGFASGGFIAVFMPFFSETLLPDEEGTHDQIIDHRKHEATPTNGRAPTYYCARASFNGHHIKQRCNPNPGANDFVVRELFEDLVDTLKKGHWIDHQTRLMSVTMQLRNNNGGVRFIARYMFEITQMGAVLPSYDMETLIDDDDNETSMRLWMLVALGLTMWFAMLEGVELLQSGPSTYFTNTWNVMDWANFGLFALVYLQLQNTLALNARDKEGYCPSKICKEFGFYDMWEVFDMARSAKFFMSICVCIQLLKIIKFTNVIVPKMSLMTRVISKGCYDLIFFGIIFGVSMFAFCMLFYIQLGSFMDDFYSQASSAVALAKALFGDFPFEEIIDNSRGYTNGMLFLVYLFVAVFILLSMFLAILGEAQAAVRDDENLEKERGEFPNQYGFLGEMSEFVQGKISHYRSSGKEEDEDEAAAAKKAQEEQIPGLDSALNMALTKMQKKLDASVLNRMTALEQRLAQRLSSLDFRVGAEGSHASTGRTGPNGRRASAREERSASNSGGRPGLSECSKSESPTKLLRAGSVDKRGGNEAKMADDRSRDRRDGDDRSKSKGGGANGGSVRDLNAAPGDGRGGSQRPRKPSISMDMSPPNSPRGAGANRRATPPRRDEMRRQGSGGTRHDLAC